MLSLSPLGRLGLFMMATALSLIPGVLAGKPPPTPDPFADPKNDPNNPLRYIPSNALSAVGVALYFIVSCTMVALLNKSRWSARYMLCVIIGGFGECWSYNLFDPCFSHLEDLLGGWTIRGDCRLTLLFVGCPRSYDFWIGDAIRAGQETRLERDIYRRIPVRPSLLLPLSVTHTNPSYRSTPLS